MRRDIKHNPHKHLSNTPGGGVQASASQPPDPHWNVSFTKRVVLVFTTLLDSIVGRMLSPGLQRTWFLLFGLFRTSTSQLMENGAFFTAFSVPFSKNWKDDETKQYTFQDSKLHTNAHTSWSKNISPNNLLKLIMLARYADMQYKLLMPGSQKLYLCTSKYQLKGSAIQL